MKETISTILENSSLSESDKRQIKSLIESKNNPLASRSFILQGDAGVGKTFLAENLIESLGKKVVYMSCAGFGFKNSARCDSFKDLLKKIDNKEEQIIFLDDLNYIFKKDRFEINSEDKRDFMNILEIIRIRKNKILIVTLNDWVDLDSRMIDRFEARIIFDLPTDEEKKNFLKNNFKKLLKHDIIEHISKNTIGYNYRDLNVLVKISYKTGISMESVKEAIKNYKPSQLFGFEVENISNTKLSDISEKKDVIKTLSRIAQMYKKENLAEQLGMKRANLLLFQGPPGTGKTYAARALAGEIECPIILVEGSNIQNMDPCASINKIVSMAKRFEKCIIFIDEAEKMFNSRWGDDNYLIGEFNRALESDGKKIKAIVILASNDVNRLGEALQDRFTTLKFGMPSYGERFSFCKNKADLARGRISAQINHDFLARITKDMSFRDIERLWNELMFQHIENGKDIDEEVIHRAARELRKEEEGKIIFG